MWTDAVPCCWIRHSIVRRSGLGALLRVLFAIDFSMHSASDPRQAALWSTSLHYPLMLWAACPCRMPQLKRQQPLAYSTSLVLGLSLPCCPRDTLTIDPCSVWARHARVSFWQLMHRGSGLSWIHVHSELVLWDWLGIVSDASSGVWVSLQVPPGVLRQ